MVAFARKIFGIALLAFLAFGASAQTVLSPSSPIEDSLKSFGQVNSYQIVLPVAGKVEITFAHSPFITTITGLWTVSVMTTSGVELMSLYSGQTDGSVTAPVGLPAGTYRVQVATYSSRTSAASLLSVPYQIQYAETAATATNAFEQQTGVATRTPTPMTAGVKYEGALARRIDPPIETDLWSFTLNQAGQVALDFQHKQLSTLTGFWNISVMTTDGKELMSDYSAPIGGHLSLLIGLPVGTYVVQVTTTSSASPAGTILNVPYYLSYALTPASAGAAFELQTGEITSTPTPVSEGVTYTGTLAPHLDGINDVDSWAITLAQAGDVSLKFEHNALTSITGYWLVAVKTTDGAELMSFFSNPSDGSLTMPLGLPAGTYVVQVSTKSSSSAAKTIQNVPYKLSYRLTPAASNTAFEQQTGVATSLPTPMNADVIYSGTLASHVTGGPTDIDRWSLVIAQAGNVSLHFGHEPLSTIKHLWKVSLKTATGTEILSFVSGQTDGSLIVPVGLQAGSYLVDVTAYSSAFDSIANVPYELSYSFISGAFFEQEVNKDASSASPLVLGTTPYAGAIQPRSPDSPNSDVDYFKFTIDHAHNLQVKLLPTSVPLTLVLTNLDAASATVYTGKTSTTVGINVVVRAPAGRYALSVAGNGGNLGVPYTLAVNDLGQAIQHFYSLRKGWNLLGNSFDVAINAAEFATGNSAPVTSIWKWDPTKTQWQFYSPSMSTADLTSYAQSKGYAVLAQIQPREGFWVNASDVSSSQVFTVVPTLLGIDDIKMGWNLVASGGGLDPRQLNSRLSTEPPAFSTDSQVAATLPSNFLTMWAWNNASSQWYFYAPSIDQPNASTTLQNYTASKNYLNFFGSLVPKVLDQGDGFWINR